MLIWWIEKTSRKDEESAASSVRDLMPIFVYRLLNLQLNRIFEGLREFFGTGNDYNGKCRGKLV